MDLSQIVNHPIPDYRGHLEKPVGGGEGETSSMYRKVLYWHLS